MKFDKRTDKYVLSSGRMFYANGGILGLGLDIDPNILSYGADGAEWFGDGVMSETPLTADERAEIADEMIRRWQRWRAG